MQSKSTLILTFIGAFVIRSANSSITFNPSSPAVFLAGQNAIVTCTLPDVETKPNSISFSTATETNTLSLDNDIPDGGYPVSVFLVPLSIDPK